ncbi:MAG: DNA topoisomerase 4 subunit A [Clostridia bacterium]|nr:DNA topoisomerase 4 subunit A [Clostridia bacterium]
MARKKTGDSMDIVKPEIILQRTMESVMHASMMPYSEHVILERALPRVEDGLKPVQRRILYTMQELSLSPDKPHRKCARIVGDCLGKYHPHGDSSVYGALARMAQDFALRAPLVDGHGNFGSIDGDSPAAMRYTEARMTNLAMEMLRDIDKDTVGFHLNFDDTQKEPDLLPGRFPNLLVNGADGIAVGLATNIPPHNLAETINGVIAQLDNPDITTRELMKYIPAPDFPTGGVLACTQELLQAYETGRGKVQLRAKIDIESGNAGRKLIVVTEMTYGKNKSAVLEKILKLSEEKKALFSGIYDIRDESDRTGMRAVIELKKDADADRTLAALYKYSELQDTVGINMVAIADGKPMQMGLKAILGHYIRHQKEVVTRRTKYDLEQALARAHILEGLIIAVDNLDEVIRLIRSSKNPKEAREKLVARFSLTEIQAQAILDMRLQRLTNLEILSLRNEHQEILKKIKMLEGILKSEKKLIGVIKNELTEIKEKYADERRTKLVEAFDEVEIAPEKPVADEAVVYMTAGGFVKRMPPKAYDKALQAGEIADPPKHLFRCETEDRLLFFTDLGNCFPITVSQVPECRVKDRGLPLGGLLAGLEKGENAVSILLFAPGAFTGEILFVSKYGLVKRVDAREYDINRAKFAGTGLKAGDSLKYAARLNGEANLLMISKLGMSIHYRMNEISLIGRTAAGVKGMTLQPDDEIAFALPNDEEGEAVLVSDKGYMKRCLLIDFDLQSRAGKGVKCFNFQKNGANGQAVVSAFIVKQPFDFTIRQKSGEKLTLNTSIIKIERKDSRGSMYAMCVLDDIVESVNTIQ